MEGHCSLEGLEGSPPELDSVNHDSGRPPDRPILHNDWKLALSARPPRVASYKESKWIRLRCQSSSKPSNDWQLFNYLIISKMHTGQIQILAIYSLSAKSAPLHLPDLETFQIHLKCQRVNHILQFFLLKPLRNLFL